MTLRDDLNYISKLNLCNHNFIENTSILSSKSLRGRGWYKKTKEEGKSGYWAGGTNRANILLEISHVGSYELSGLLMFKSMEIKSSLKIGILGEKIEQVALINTESYWFAFKNNIDIDERLRNIGILSIEFYCDNATNERELRSGSDQTLKSFFLAELNIIKK